MRTMRIGRCFVWTNWFYSSQTVSGIDSANLHNVLVPDQPVGGFGVNLYLPIDPPEGSGNFSPRPSTSKHDERGDTDCEHFNLKGVAVQVPSRFKTTKVDLSYWTDSPKVHYEPFMPNRYSWYQACDRWTFPSIEFINAMIAVPDFRSSLYGRFRQVKVGKPFTSTHYSFECVDVIWHTIDSPYNYYCIATTETKPDGSSSGPTYVWYRFNINRPSIWTAYYYNAGSSPELPGNVRWRAINNRHWVVEDLSTHDNPAINLDKVRKLIPRHPINEDFGPLVNIAFEDTKVLNVNTLMFLSKAISLPSSGIEAIARLGRDPTLANAASAFLFYDYGLRLSYNQTISVQKSLNSFVEKEPRAQVLIDSGIDLESLRQLWSDIMCTTPDDNAYLTCRAMSGIEHMSLGIADLDDQLFFKAYYKPYDNAFSQIYTAMYQLNVDISAEKIWDAIPYSFVVDWFISIGDYLASVDTSNYIMTLDILGCLLTQRCDFRNFCASSIADSTASTLLGDVSLRYYLRLRSDRVPNPVTAPEISPNVTFRHAVEGGSLILQRTQ